MNGENTAPVYKFLKSGKWGIIGDDIQWNFAKFLVDKDGQAVDRYYPTTSPLTIEVKPRLQFMFDFQSSVSLCCLIVLLWQKIILFYQSDVILLALWHYCSMTSKSFWEWVNERYLGGDILSLKPVICTWLLCLSLCAFVFVRLTDSLDLYNRICDYDAYFPSSVLVSVGLELQSEQNPFLCIDAVYQFFLFIFPFKSEGNFLLDSYKTNYIALSKRHS